MADFTDWDQELIPSLRGGRRQPTRRVTYKIEGDCWICTSHKSSGFGYPYIKIDKQSFSLPRFICLLFNPPSVENSVVRHLCDNPLCINPDHLRMGSQKENIRDMLDRNRVNRKGEKSSQTSLKDKDVRLIRWASHYLTQRELGGIYGLTQQGISDIIRKKSWRYI